MYVPPWTILAGLGALSRRELCDYVASFEVTTLASLSMDRATDMLARWQKGVDDREAKAFLRRLEEVTIALNASSLSEKALRIRLFVRVAAALDIKPTLPLSTRSAHAFGAEASCKAATIAARPVKVTRSEDQSGPLMSRLWSGVISLYCRDTLGFEQLVVEEAQRIIAALTTAANSGALSEAEKQDLFQRIRVHLDTLPEDPRDKSIRLAIKQGDVAAMALLASGTAALTTGIGVNLAGFSAYILAAQAAAYIPFMGGSTAVSILFLLANPLFSVPAVVGAGYALNRHVNGGQAGKLASALVIQLALRGLSVGRDALAMSLDDFRSVGSDDLHSLPASFRHDTLARIVDLRNRAGGRLPGAPGAYGSSEGETDRFGQWLRGAATRNGADIGEMAAVAALTAGDILYHAASIDPLVLAAADFSRFEDISDMFQFEAFAGKLGSMAQASAAGASNNLRGYVSEQLVAARLVESGHVVSFPEAANNPGFDLLVDGMPFQVKCLNRLDGLREHFANYPDMPVYANSELAEDILQSGAAWAGQVFYIDGFDREIADLIMKTSLEAGEALGDLNVPYFAMAIASARNLHQVWRGRMPLSDLPFTVVMNAAIKGGLSMAGGVSGKMLGLLAFGPAGALILSGLGGVGALAGTGWVREQAARALSPEWHMELDSAAESFRKLLVDAIVVKIDLLRSKHQQLPEHPAQSWLMQRFEDDILTLFEVIYELEVCIPKLPQPSRSVACLAAMDSAKVHPVAVNKSLQRLILTLNTKPSTPQAAGKKAKELLKKFQPRFR